MALTDKNILITPNIGQTADPKIVFSGADSTTTAQNITLQVYPTNNGTLSFEGSAGQLFSITNSLSGSIFSVNDISGIPSLEILDTGAVKLAQYSGNVLLGTGTDNATDKLQVNGSITSTVLKSTVATGTAPLTVTSTTKVTNLNADYVDGASAGTSWTDITGGTLPVRHASGYLYSNYFNTPADITATSPSHVAIQTASDNYIRWQTLAQFKTNLNISGGQFFGTAATKAIAYNSNSIAENVTVTAGNNGISAGPITISSGFTVTVESGANWVIV